MAPDGWRELQVQDVARVILGQSPPSADVAEEPSSEEDEIPFLQGNAEFKDRFPSASSWTRTAPRTAPQDSILVSVRAPVGDVNQADEEYGIGRGLAAVVANGDGGALKDYLFWVLSNAQAYYTSRKQGTTFDSIKKKDLKELSLNLPPLPEQKKIAAILASVDDAITATRKVIEQTKQVKKELLQDLMIRGIGHTRFKETEIGQIPEKWELESADSLCEKISVGIVVRPASHYVDEGVPCIRSANISVGGIVDDGWVYISEESSQEHSKSILQTGDVVVVRSGEPGTACVVPRWLDTCNCVDVIFARPDPERLRSHFLSWFLNSHAGRKQVLQKRGGLAQKHLNVGALKKMLIPVPPLQEQDSIIESISCVGKAEEAAEGENVHLRKLRRVLMQDLLTGRVRVPVG